MSKNKVFFLLILVSLISLVVIACDQNPKKREAEVSLAPTVGEFLLPSWYDDLDEFSFHWRYYCSEEKPVVSAIKESDWHDFEEVKETGLGRINHLKYNAKYYVGLRAYSTGTDNRFSVLFFQGFYGSEENPQPISMNKAEIVTQLPLTFRGPLFPEELVVIPENAFYKTIFETVDIPDNVVEIKKDAFANCTYLKHVTLPASLTTVTDDAFRGCINLEKNVIFKNKLLQGKVGTDENDTTAIVPNNVTEIGFYAFWKNPNLHTVEIPSTVTTIGQLAFNACSNLEMIKYSGTKAAWIAMTSSTELDLSGVNQNCKIYCTDETITPEIPTPIFPSI